MPIPEWLKNSGTATYFGGLATFVSVLTALFLERYWKYSQRAHLCVHFDGKAEGDLRYLPLQQEADNSEKDEREELWIRLRVANQGSTPAIGVQVRLICTQREGDTYRENRPSLWFKISNLDAVSITIPQKFTQYFDLAYLKRTTNPPADVQCFLPMVRDDFKSWEKARPQIEANRDRSELELGLSYDVYFAVVSSNADAAYYRMKLKPMPRRSGDGQPGQDPNGNAAWLKRRIDVGQPEKVSANEAFPRQTRN